MVDNAAKPSDTIVLPQSPQKLSINGAEKINVSHSSFQEDAEASAILRSQSISPVAFFCMTIASALAWATFASVFAFDVSTEPFSQVPANSAMGPIRRFNISLSCYV